MTTNDQEPTQIFPPGPALGVIGALRIEANKDPSEYGRPIAVSFAVTLPFRVFVDDGRAFKVLVDGRTWEVIPSSLSSTQPLPGYSLAIGGRDQLRLDSSGRSGFTRLKIICRFEKARDAKDVIAEIENQALSIQTVTPVINRFLTSYRSTTEEFWIRNISSAEILAYEILLVGEDAQEHFFELRAFEHTPIAAGISYLKSEGWYRQLHALLGSGWSPPFFLELYQAGCDAFAREQYRLAATDFILSAESLIRSLMIAHFPGQDVTRPAVQMLNGFYSMYTREKGLAPRVRKKEAAAALDRIWQHRDALMHGRLESISTAETATIHDSLIVLLALWDTVGASRIRTEGPFTSQLTVTLLPATLLERANARRAHGAPDDALEALRAMPGFGAFDKEALLEYARLLGEMGQTEAAQHVTNEIQRREREKDEKQASHPTEHA